MSLTTRTNENKQVNDYKNEILENIYCTELVYQRINNKLNSQLSADAIEKLLIAIIKASNTSEFQKIGKNIYITNSERNIRLSINSNTHRIITADKLNEITTPR